MNHHESQNSSQLKYRHSDAEGESVLSQIETIRLNCVKFTLFVIATIALAGIPRLIIHWFPKLKRILYYDSAPLEESTHVAIINFDEEMTVCQLEEQDIHYDQITHHRRKCFINRYLKYVINQGTVEALVFNAKDRVKRITSSTSDGLTEGEAQALRNSYGKGATEIERPTWYIILFKQMIRPLYLFLFFSVALWYYELYNIYASIILGTSLVAIFLTVYELLTLNIKIHEMAYYEIKLNVLRNRQVREISSIEIVPGDIVFLKNAIKIPFEGVVLEGSALINQCALTGESVPVVKKADVLENYKSQKNVIDKSAYVFEGTTIVQVNSKKRMAQFESYRETYGIPVCVSRTNFVTLKGQLIRIILFPKDQENVFQKESVKFLFVLFIISVVTYIGVIPKLREVVTTFDLIIKFLDLITITVPPALPVSMAFGVIYAIEKLKKKSIFCIDDNRVIVGGVVNFCCFDKTGTLTEDFMDFQALIPAHKGTFYATIKNRVSKKIQIESELKKNPYLEGIFNNMASNHSIIKIEESQELVGDPMQIKLFQFAQFSLNQSNSDPEVIFSFESTRKQTGEIYRRFQFDSDLQRMSVVSKVMGSDGEYFSAYAKGSPEMMATIVNKETLPRDYNKILNEYASNGFRVLAIASKRLPNDAYKTITRDEAEAGLNFDGFEVFENKLKPETRGAIDELKEAQIGVVMITGDNSLTGSNIGFKCGIAVKSKGMIICDYRQGRFFQQDFIYHEREEETNNTQNSLEISHQRSDEFIHNENLIPEQTQKVSKKMKLPPISIELLTKDKAKSAIVANQTLVKADQAEQYMTKMVSHARERNCQLCVTGNAFNRLFEGKVEEISQLKRNFLECTTIFARTKPNDKAKIVMVYQHTSKTVSMCGDGANDCGALKQADIGLSLSQAEASISAPFTSQITNISSMVELIKECRAGLATNFSLFNIMASYSLTQYTTTIIAQIYYSYPADLHYLYWDIGCNFFFIVFVGYTATTQRLSVAIPNNSLFCFTNLFQVLSAFALNVIGQISMIIAISGTYASTIDYFAVGGFEYNQSQYLVNEDWSLESPEVNILFLFTNFMYLFTLLAFNIGQPWRKVVFTNILFMIVFVLIMTYTIVITMVPESRFTDYFLIHITDTGLSGFILGMGLLFGITIYLLQKLLWQPLSIWLRKTYPLKTWL